MAFSPPRHKDPQESQRGTLPQHDLNKENALAKIIVDSAFKVHTSLGPGLLESAYEECLEKEFVKRGVSYKKQCMMPVYYDGDLLETSYRVDFLVDDSVIVELKAVEKMLPVHEAQILTYMKLSNKRLGLLVNFCSPLIKDGIKRFVL